MSSRRRIFPPILFGVGALAHLLRHGRRYDIVHTAFVRSNCEGFEYLGYT